MKTLIATQTAPTLRTPSRKQAIEDGALIDLSANSTIKLHWKIPFACTFAVWFTIQANLKHNPGLQLDELLRHISISALISTLVCPHDTEVGFETFMDSEKYQLRIRIAPDEDRVKSATLSLLNED